MTKVLSAWKAVRSEATVTGDEVLGEVNDAGSAWKAVRLRKCHMYFGVVPSRHIVFASPIRALRTRLLSLRSVVPSRHLTHNFTLGIARTSSALHSLARKLAAARHSPSKLGLCSRLAQTFIFMLLFLTFSLRFSTTPPKVHVNE